MMSTDFLHAVFKNIFRFFFKIRLIVGMVTVVFLTYKYNIQCPSGKLKIRKIEKPLIHSLIHTRYLDLELRSNNDLIILPNKRMDQAMGELFKISNDTTKLSYNLWGPRESVDVLAANPRPHDDRFLAQLLLIFDKSSDLITRSSEKKKILLPRNLKNRWDPPDRDPLGLESCPFGKKCELVFEGRVEAHRYRANISGAIIFTRNYRLPIKKNTLYRQDLPDDVLVFFRSLESDFVTNARLTKRNDIFSSYWTGADIVTPYGKWVYHNPSIRQNKIGKNYAAGKTKLAAIFLSNCKPSNTRNRYLQLLMKHMQVDVYGRCRGTHTCPRTNETVCYQKLKKEYKFYLAFENANCRDYITEKFWHNALSHDVVPVVLGAHPEDYRAASPKNSYIHVEDFESPRHLAAYLQYLDTHDEEYNKYFEWKGTGKIIVETGLFLCRVCLLLHYADIVPPPSRNQTFEVNAIASVKNHLCLPKRRPYWTRNSKLE